jgi:hypothetical protein
MSRTAKGRDIIAAVIAAEQTFISKLQQRLGILNDRRD